MEIDTQPIIAPSRPTIITSTEKVRYEVYSGPQPGTYQVTKDVWALTLYNRAGVIKPTTNRTSIDFMI